MFCGSVLVGETELEYNKELEVRDQEKDLMLDIYSPAKKK
jgi:hypothetical protein